MSTNAVSGIGASIVRTAVPLIVGLVITIASKVGIDLNEDPDTVVAITAGITSVISVLYYALVRFLETRIAPGWGWLLGYANAPRYDNPEH